MSTWSSRSGQRPRRTSSARRRPRLTKVSGAWGAITALIGLIALMVQSVELMVTAIVCLLITIVAAFAGQSVAVPTRGTDVRKTSSPGKSRSRQPATQKPGTPSKPRRCSVRCRKSSKPAASCNCSCGGKSHGSESGVSTTAPPSKPKLPTKSQLRSKRSRQHERRVVRQQRKATP